MNNKGQAVMETLALLFIFIVLITYTVGSFGVVHTAILNSISARAYAFETFNNRADLIFFRDKQTKDQRLYYEKVGFRLHGVTTETSQNATFEVTERLLTRGSADGDASELSGRNPATHQQLNSMIPREQVGVNPVWIKTVYGICVTPQCGS